MPRLSDLALDSLLYTQINDSVTTHTFPEVDDTGRRSVRTELWKHEQLLGNRGHVRLERCISSGQKLGTLRAVKLVKKSESQTAQDFSQELEVTAKFSNDRYRRWFAKSFGWFEDSVSVCITMEYCMYGHLQYHLSTRRPLPATETQQLTFQILEALHQMHGNDFVHTDLKPRNILIKSMPPSQEWWVVLAGFGIARRADKPSGVDDFMAPEFLQLDNEDTPKLISYSKAGDMWALGEIVARMLTGEATFRSLQELSRYCSREIFPFDHFSVSATADGIDFISNLMAVDPDARLSTAQSLQHPWMASQRMSVEDGFSVLNMNQNTSPVRVQPSISSPVHWGSLSGSASTAVSPRIQRKPVKSPSFHQTTSSNTEERQIPSSAFAVAEEKQVYLGPSAMTSEGILLPTRSAESEEKQVCPKSSTEMEEKQVVFTSSNIPNQPIPDSFAERAPTLELKAHTLPINAAVFSPDGMMIVSASDGGNVTFWDRRLGDVVRTLEAHKNAANSVTFSPDGRTIASASANVEGIIKLWDLNSGERLKTFRSPSLAVSAVAFSPDGNTLASASRLDEGSILLSNAQSGAPLKMLNGHWLTVNTLTFSPDGRTIASASHDGSVRTWDAQTGHSLKAMTGYTQWANAIALEPSGIRAESLAPGTVPGGIRDVAYSPDGKLLASASEDGTIKVWDSRGGVALQKFRRKWRWSTVSPVGINTVRFSPGGMVLASASDDGMVKLLDLRMGAIIQTIKAHSKWISAIGFSPEGKTLASASHDGTIRMWE